MTNQRQKPVEVLRSKKLSFNLNSTTLEGGIYWYLLFLQESFLFLRMILSPMIITRRSSLFGIISADQSQFTILVEGKYRL